MLFYSVVVIAWAATSLATPPPGYVKKPDSDKDPPAYEYKYEIGDGNGEGQGKEETRTGEFASGSYYVNTGRAGTDVKYFADDWGYHPVVKYGSADKHSSTSARFALGEHAVKALQSGGDVGPKVELPGESQKRRRPVQIIQPYTIEKGYPGATSTPTYPAIESDDNDTSDVDGAQDTGEYSKQEFHSFGKESGGPSTVLISTSSHLTTPQEIAYTATSPAAPIPYVPLQEVRDIYANNDYQNAALIDEQLFLQSAAGNFGQRVNSALLGESGVESNRQTYPSTKENGDVTYTVYSGPNSNTAYLSAAGKIKAQGLQNRYQNRDKFAFSSTTEIPNYSVAGLSTAGPASLTTPTGEYTSNDLVGEKQEKYEYVSSQEFSKFGPADPSLLNYGLAAENQGQNGQQENRGYLPPKIEDEARNNGLQVFSSEFSSSSFKPIVVGEVTPGYDETEHSTACKCGVDLVAPTTPSPIFSTTPQAIISSETVAVTPKYQSQDHITTSAVILNPIQAGVALVNAGEAHLINDGESSGPVKVDLSQDSVSTNGVSLEERIQQLHNQQQENELRIENQVHQERLKKVQDLQEEIQLQQVQQYQQEIQLQQNQYEIQNLQLEQQLQKQIQIEELEQRQKLEEEAKYQSEKEQQILELQQRQKLEQEAQYQIEQQQKYQYEQLTKDTQIRLEELQQRQKLEEEAKYQREKEQEIQELQHREKLEEEAQYQIEQQQKYQYQQLTNDAQLRQEAELQRVEESQQSDQLPQENIEKEIQPVHESKVEVELDQKHHQDVILQQQIQEQVKVQQEEVEQYEALKIRDEIENQQAQQLLLQQQQQYQIQVQQQLENYRQLQLQQQQQLTQNNVVQGPSASKHGQDIEIQKSIEIYHNEPAREIHYPVAKVESSQIDQSQTQPQYVELQSVENAEQAFRGQVKSGAKVSFDINHGSVDQGYQLSQKEVQFSLHGAENQAQQVFVGDNQAKLNEAYDLNRGNALSQQTSTNNGGVVLGFRVNHESDGLHNYQIDQHRENGILAHEIDQPVPQRVIFAANSATGAYLNQRDHSHSHSQSHSYESNRGQQQVAVGLPYTLEASKELVLPGVSETAGNPVFEKHHSTSISEHYGEGKYAIESSNESSGQHVTVLQPYPAAEKVIEKTVHVPYPVEQKVPFPVEVEKIIEKQVPVHILRPYPVEVEKVIEKKVPYPVDRVVEKHVPILHPYPVHIKVPHPYPVEKIVERPYPVETIVEKPIHIHVPVEKIVEKTVPVPQPYPVEIEKIIEKKIPYPVEVTKYVDKPVPVHVPQPYPVEKIIRVPFAVDLGRNIPYGVHYGVSYQQIMRPHSHNLYVNHGKTRTPFYGLPVVTRHQEYRHQENSHHDGASQFQGYGYEKPSISFVEGVGIEGGQHSVHQNLAKQPNPHLFFPHYPVRRQHTARTNAGKDKPRTDEYIGPVPPQRSSHRHLQHSIQNKHVVQARSPQSLTPATRSPTSTTTSRRAREPETKPQSSAGNFRQSRVEYGFKPPMKPSVQYDEKTATKVES